MSGNEITVLIVGASGMLGHTVMRLFANSPGYRVWGSSRSGSFLKYMPKEQHERLVTGIDADNPDNLHRLFDETRPDLVINCIGMVKQLAEADDPLSAIPINAILPHRIARLCKLIGARLVHVSTDCVFSGSRGNYRETDHPDAGDLYGRSKLLGEVDYPHAITLRTSIVGHELKTAHGLVGWFLSQQGRCKGYTKAIFSGLPTVVLAQIIRDIVIPRPDLSGVYHVAAQPISKYDLLKLIASVYKKQIEITPDDKLVIDRSLNADRFGEATGYVAPDWPTLIKTMHSYN